MKKLKTSKSIKKRIKVTSSGKFLRHKASRSHLLQKKTSNRKQKLKQVTCINKKDASSFTQKLPYLSK
ncbi:50S ribosomal protein L35 (plastid) [Chondrus crispus]|uniref:50S ribosomal protein L35 n=1 Tax=Chondrus crispus TaxID=2769 RepID=M5DCZ3_CHOCR|nr:50S ribosomal protein L35 [Chondrus crispus]CCP38155.1 50S ribosomal protein L35 [Chondrus crispus]|eukprot:YP_007627408.1 50S ribosomal protein L35 (plastid) [Chondrus crispus]